MTQWAVIIDLSKCIGCGTCSQVCNLINHIHQGRKIVEKTIQNNGKLSRLFIPISCMHCKNPPCLSACPTSATKKSRDGIVFIDHGLCIGCHACILACPYRARSILTSESLSVNSQNDNHYPQSANNCRIGLCSKCDLCRVRVEKANTLNLRPGIDSEVTPLCIENCIAGALSIVDVNDSDNALLKIIHQKNIFRIREDLGTDPAVYYITDSK
jgi:phenylacetyl-CoA:acceptor oxidoreductase subunit 1